MATYPSPYSYLKAASGGTPTPAAQKVQAVQNSKQTKTQRSVSFASTFTVST